VNPETWAVSKSDLFMKDPTGRDADHIAFGSTLSNDRHAGMRFDYLIANPPYGKDWKGALEAGRETSRRLACDASRVVLRHDGAGRVVEIVARTRTIPPALRRVLQQRDRGCRFPGAACGWPRGIIFATGRRAAPPRSPTWLCFVADITAPSTRRATRSNGGRIIGCGSFAPDGLELPEVPAPAVVPEDPVGALRTRHEIEGLGIDARTGCAGWLGDAWTWSGRSTFCVRRRRALIRAFRLADRRST
jgi:hypothetical protein